MKTGGETFVVHIAAPHSSEVEAHVRYATEAICKWEFS